jgi:hypothetical protein
LKPSGCMDCLTLTKFGYTILGAAWAVSVKYEIPLTPLRNGIFEAAKAGKICVRDPATGLPSETDALRDYYEYISVADLDKWFSDCGSQYHLTEMHIDITAILPPDRTSTKSNSKNVWDEHALRKLYFESIEHNATPKNLAEQYGITRQGIERQIKAAKEQFGTNAKVKPASSTWKPAKKDATK